MRFAVRLACCIIAAGGLVPAIADDPRVADLDSARFERVAGGGSQGASLDVGPPGSWYSGTVGMPTVMFDGHTYRMWFVGDEPTDDPAAPYGIYQRIGLATNTDGLRWTVENDCQPVLDLGPPGSPDAKGLAHPYVLKNGDEYWMWYGAIDGRLAGDLGLRPASVRVERICLATSHDGIQWQRGNGGRPVLDIGPPGSIDGIQVTGMHVLKVGDLFWMWYGAYGSEQHTIVMATSPDGVNWTRYADGAPLRGLVGGGQGQLGASVYHDGRRFFMLYGSDQGGQWRTYAAISDDGFRFRQWHGETPIMERAAAGNFDTAGVGRNHVTHPSQFIVAGDRVRVWYMGEDGSPPHFQRIGLMEASWK